MRLPTRELSALILAALFLFPGTQGIVRGQNTLDASAGDGGPAILDSRTVNDFGTIPVSITGIDSREVAASGIGSFNLNLITAIATSGLLSLSGFSVDGAAALDRTSTLDNPSITDLLRRDNRLEAGAGQNLTSIGQMYSTSRAQPAVLAINGGALLSIHDQGTGLPPPGRFWAGGDGAGRPDYPRDVHHHSLWDPANSLF